MAGKETGLPPHLLMELKLISFLNTLINSTLSLFLFLLLKKKVLSNHLTMFGQRSKQKMFPNFIRRQGFVKVSETESTQNKIKIEP